MNNEKITRATRYILFFLITAVFGIAGLAAAIFVPELAVDSTVQLITIVLSAFILIISIIGVVYFNGVLRALERGETSKSKKKPATHKSVASHQQQTQVHQPTQPQQQSFQPAYQQVEPQIQQPVQQQYNQAPRVLQQSQVDFSATPSDADAMPDFLLAQTQNFPQKSLPQPKVPETKLSVANPAQTTVVNYIIPSQSSYEFVPVGEFQSIEEKFAEIAKMDKTQFVIYMAKLFSRKGYTVKLTPVVDNHGIDMLVEKNGIVIAVSCLKDIKMLSADSLVETVEGRKFYACQQSIALTNMFFDKKAFEYAKNNRLSLVDRAILIDEFID